MDTRSLLPNYFDDLPDELLLHIIGSALPQALLLLTLCDKRWHNLVHGFSSTAPELPLWWQEIRRDHAAKKLYLAEKNYLVQLVRENDLATIQHGFENGLFKVNDLLPLQLDRLFDVSLALTVARRQSYQDILNYFYTLIATHYKKISQADKCKLLAVKNIQNWTLLHWAIACCQTDALSNHLQQLDVVLRLSDKVDLVRFAEQVSSSAILKILLQKFELPINYFEPILNSLTQPDYEKIAVIAEHDLSLLDKRLIMQFYQQAITVGYVEIIKLFKRKNITQLNNRPIIYLAVVANQLSIIKKVLACKLHPIDATFNDTTSLYMAAQLGHSEIVSYLLEQNANPNLLHNGYSAFYIACRNGNLAVVQLLAAYIDINRLYPNNSSALYKAIHQGHSAVVEFLLNNSAVWQHESHCTPYNLAAVEGHLDVLNQLISQRQPTVEQINKKNCKGYDALEVASGRGHVAIVEFLLALGIKPRLHKKKLTALHLACQNGHAHLIPLLLPYIPVNYATSFYSSPLFIASNWGHPACVESLLAAGASPAYFKDGKFSPLYIAAERGYVAVVKKLVQYGMVNVATPLGSTPLYIAAANGHLAVMQILYAQGADINLGRADGYTPLLVAAENKQLNCVKWLLKHNARVQSFTADGKLFTITTTPEIQLLLEIKLRIERLTARSRSVNIFCLYQPSRQQFLLEQYQFLLCGLLNDEIKINVSNVKEIPHLITAYLTNLELTINTYNHQSGGQYAKLSYQ